jgi:hypothetical protein
LQEHQGGTLAVHGRTDGDAVGGGHIVGVGCSCAQVTHLSTFTLTADERRDPDR